MSKRQTLIVLGILVIILPFLGFTGNVKTVIFFVLGLIIATVAYTLRPAQPKKPSNVPYVEHKNEPVSESKPPIDPMSSL